MCSETRWKKSEGKFIRDTLVILRHTIDNPVPLDAGPAAALAIIKIEASQMEMAFCAVVTNASEAVDGVGKIRVNAAVDRIDELQTARYADRLRASRSRFTVVD